MMTKTTQWGCRLLAIIAVAFLAVGMAAGMPVAAEEEHPLAYYREYLIDEVCNYFYRETKPAAVWSKTDEWAGMYEDEKRALHICMTDGVDLTPYEAMFDDDVLTQLATEVKKTMNCPYTAEQLLQGFSVTFEYKPYSADYLENMQVALREPFQELKIWETSVSCKDNQVEIRVEKEADCAGVIEWLSRNIENFDKNAVKFIVEKNTLQYDGQGQVAAMDTYDEDILERAIGIRIGKHVYELEEFLRVAILIALSVVVVVIATVSIIVYRKNRKKRRSE